ncbi:glycine betaine/L-proline ABC transporter substrate-binding protein ProX [Variovorax sp. LARHSF232]
MNSKKIRLAPRSLLAGAVVALGSLATQAHAADTLPGKGIAVTPVKSSLAEESFQTLLVGRALEKLGYTVEPMKDLEPATAHLAVANGDATFMANHWPILQGSFYANSGGDAKLYRKGSYSDGAVQGYMIDRKTAEQYHITNIEQMKEPKIAALFDADGDGTADLTGCNPGWGCELSIEHQLTAYKLRGKITHKQGSYAALMADTISRYKAGKSIFYYTWTPYWVSAVLRPGKDVVWLQVPFSATEAKDMDTMQPNGRNYGFPPDKQQIVANKAFANENPAAAKLFEIMKLPIGDIGAQNLRMSQGQNSEQDIERQVDGWIRAHQKQFDGWIATARAAAES